MKPVSMPPLLPSTKVGNKRCKRCVVSKPAIDLKVDGHKKMLRNIARRGVSLPKDVGLLSISDDDLLRVIGFDQTTRSARKILRRVALERRLDVDSVCRWSLPLGHQRLLEVSEKFDLNLPADVSFETITDADLLRVAGLNIKLTLRKRLVQIARQRNLDLGPSRPWKKKQAAKTKRRQRRPQVNSKGANDGMGYGKRRNNLKSMGFDSYETYLKSAIWKRIRNRVFARSSACMCCGQRADVVHHRSYDMETLSGSTLSRLVPICDGCHHLIEFDGDKKRLSMLQVDKVFRQLVSMSNSAQ